MRGPSVDLRQLTCRTQDHLIFLTLLIIAMTFVRSVTPLLVFLSLFNVLSILFSIWVCAAASSFCVCLVSVQVYTPYVVAGSTQGLYTCLSKQMARLLLKISLCLLYAPSLLRFFVVDYISVSWFFSLRLWCCPRFTYPSTVSISTLFTFIVVLSTTMTFVFAMFILRPIRLLSLDSSCFGK